MSLRRDSPASYRVAIGVMAHNEARNLGRLLERLSGVELDVGEVRIIVVASGCTDDSEAIARRAVEHDPRIEVIVDPQRRGKAVAINQFIAAAAAADVLVMESGDTIPEPGAIPRMVARFADPAIGMVGARPVPEDDENTFLGFTNQLLWRLHHAVASVSPKQGELVAWRNIVPAIPEDAVVDEAYLEDLITRMGYRLAYEPQAIVRNRGAATMDAFITQRRRNHAGHRALAARQGYRPATRDHLLLARLALKELVRRPLRAHWLVGAALLENWAAALGWWDHAIAGRSHIVWTMVEGTKALAAADAGTPSVTAISVSHSEPANVVRCLDSLKRGAYPRLRTIVIDNGGAGSADAVRNAHPEVEVLRLRNDGLASAVNVGIRAALAAGSEYVLLLNDDVVLADDFLEQALAAASRDPRIASVTGPVFYYDDPERLWYAGGEILWWLGKTFHRGRRVIWGPAFDRPRTISYGSGAAALVRADALRAVGGWDERYFLVFEDADWCVRASRKGWRNHYAPAARAWHRVSASFGGEKAAPYLYFLFRNNLRFMWKHGRPWHLPTFLAFFVLESLLRYSLTSLAAPDRWRRLRAIWLAVFDAFRGRFGRGSWLPSESGSAVRARA